MKDTLACDGCGIAVDLAQIHLYTDYNQVCRYCATCLTEYKSFVTVLQAREATLQREMDAYVVWARERLQLALTPFDIAKARPARRQFTQQEEGLILA